MAIVKMKHLRLAAMQSDREALLRLLQGMGCLEIEEPSVDWSDPEWAGLKSPDSGALSAAREEKNAAQHALEVLKRYAKVKGGLLSPRPVVSPQQFFEEQAYRSALETARAINDGERELAALKAERDKRAAQRASLAPWIPLELPLDTASTREVEVQFGTVSAETPFPQLAGEVQAVSELAQLTLASADRENQYLLLICHRSALDEVLEKLKEHGWSRAVFRDLTGTAADNDRRLEQEMEELSQRRAEQERRIAAQAGQREALKRAVDRASVEIDREEGKSRLVETQVAFFLEGWVPEETPFPQLAGEVQAVSELAQLTLASADRENQYLLLICHRSALDEVLEKLKEHGWSRAVFRDLTGTAADNDRRLEQEMEELSQRRAEQERRIAAQAGQREALKRAVDRASVEIDREEGKSRLVETQVAFFLEGWVPEERWDQLRQALSDYPCAWEVRDPEPEEYPQVPVQLKNNWLTRPLNMVTEMYSLPAYGSVDPNPLMAPFFILFYGIMMADMGYGLLMMLASVVVLRRMRPKGTMSHFFGLLGLCGVSTFLMGAVTGGFFGDMIPQVLKILNPESTFVWFWPPLFTPLDDTLMILVGAMALGLIQIVTGMAISFIKKIREGQILDAVWEELTWWIVFAGLALAVLGVTNVVIILGGVMVLVGSGWNAKGFGKVTAVFGSLYNHVTGYFGDILSYSRLMALMLAGSVIAQVFNTLGAIPGNLVIFFIISLAGNALNFALNLLGCYVHDLRLQCLEYFGKFYQDGGKPFRPMAVNTRYVDIKEQ